MLALLAVELALLMSQGSPMDSVHKITDIALTKETQSRGYNLWGRGCGEAEEKQAGENTQWGKKYFLRILED